MKTPNSTKLLPAPKPKNESDLWKVLGIEDDKLNFEDLALIGWAAFTVLAVALGTVGGVVLFFLFGK